MWIRIILWGRKIRYGYVWRSSEDCEWFYIRIYTMYRNGRRIFFDNPDILCIGGYLPIVVMKKDGSFIPMTQYVLTHKSQKELRKFKI